ncbi:hypothetical protein NB640_04270 [Oxalobacter vibrioformis]|uniref:Uncharacterized protein n=1 Tax=Oxalobacter vibrioformis TaxID=933080 RepID=A0A9E9M1N6_9BURK|nr:hypothetical protein [Oxalobacter vibrioformis]WAW10868.1 hypothetical protein NB640_04270 [Oxalobacter vibrioformis]
MKNAKETIQKNWQKFLGCWGVAWLAILMAAVFDVLTSSNFGFSARLKGEFLTALFYQKIGLGWTEMRPDLVMRESGEQVVTTAGELVDWFLNCRLDCSEYEVWLQQFEMLLTTPLVAVPLAFAVVALLNASKRECMR